MSRHRLIQTACLVATLAVAAPARAATTFVQALLSGSSKTSGSSLVITGSISVTTGNDIFLAFATDDGGSAYSVSATGATVSWTEEANETDAGHVVTQLWRGSITSGGTLTAITISWTTAVTAKAAASAEFSGTGTLGNVYAANNAGTSAPTAAWWTGVTHPSIANGLLVGSVAWEQTNNDAITPASGGSDCATVVQVAQSGTTGGGAASNITMALQYGLPASVVANCSMQASITAGAANSWSAASYNPASGGVTPSSHPNLLTLGVAQQ